MIFRVRPGLEALRWLRRTLAQFKGDDSLQPVTVVVSNYVVGRFLLRELALQGGFVNVRTMLLNDLASSLAPVADEGSLLLNDVVEAAAVRVALRDAGGPLRSLEQHLSLQQELVRLFRELRRAEVDVHVALQTQGGPIAIAALNTYLAFLQHIRAYRDPTTQRALAAAQLEDAQTLPSQLREIGPVVVFLPSGVDPVDARLLRALARWVPVTVALARLPDHEPDSPSKRSEQLLADVLQIQPTDTDGTPERHEFRVIRTLDPAEEVRQVVREIAADLDDQIPLYRIAVLYRQADPYARLVRESLAAAGLPWFGLGGRMLVESQPARLLLGVLRLPERSFSREAVLGWLDARPAVESGIPASAWDRLSRAAGIVRGAEQWHERLLNFAAQQSREAESRPEESATSWRNFLEQHATMARRMTEVIDGLASALQAPPDRSTWTAFADWTERIRQHVATPAGGWPADQEREAEAVQGRLRQLGEADRLDAGGATLADFVAALEAALQNRSSPEGHLGAGVVIGPVESAAGLAFDRVYIVGLTEGTFPPTPRADPFFPNDTADPLGRRAVRSAAERESFLSAVAAGDGGRLTLTAPDSLEGRVAFPSHWLLDSVRNVMHPAPIQLDAATFHGLRERENMWLRVVESPRDGVVRAPSPADLEDHRLRAAAEWCVGGRLLSDHPLAARPELAIGTGLQFSTARQSDRFTIYDGNVEAIAGSATRLLRLVDGSGMMSATGLQSWARCPYRYFAERVLRVEPTVTPEHGWTIDALEKGRLIHGILEAFFRNIATQRATDGSRGDYTAAEVATLERLAEEEFERSEQRGVTGHPLAWEAARTQIRADLLGFLIEDATWRQQAGLVPAYFEQPFGMDVPEAWPAVQIRVGDGALQFRGYIDRVDVSPDGLRAFVFDYKTGRYEGYMGLEDDPVLAGTSLQMALYTRAVRAQVGEDAQVSGAYWFVTHASGFRRLALPDDRARVEGRLDEAVGRIATGIAGGVFPAVPGEEDRDSFKNCYYCPYDRVCSASRDRDWDHKQQDGCDSFLSLAAPVLEASADET